MIAWIHGCQKEISNFPFQEYLPHLIASLQDPNELVRARARDTLIQIFHDSEECRMPIKKELVIQNIRSSISEPLLAAFAGQKEAHTPSEILANTKKELLHISPKQLESEVDRLLQSFKGKESEDNWRQREDALKWIQENLLALDERQDLLQSCSKLIVDGIISSVLPFCYQIN